ncbi:MAG: hypothetical protein KBT21_11820 [Treponema sp.]|nr:hypothetical protein [Candidatus Treponema merdequi]
MNKLSFSIENVELSDGYEKFVAECFFYLVDGKKLEYQGYNPLSYWEVIEDSLQDDHFDNKEMVLISCCTCGYWECDCVVAVVTEKPSSVMWQIHKRWHDEILATYEFDKGNYISVMEQMKKAADERVESGASWKKEEIEK